mmetsp:Transcript_13734/g.31761  ORF Transcript_13734/g.31761 Transcript_13734/m.31761 type:complete len:259 (-) Transcript_13734:8766-9542(-)
MTPPCLKVCRSNRGSIVGSSSSPTFSRSTGVPNWMAFSRVRTKSESLNLITLHLCSFSMFFTHLFACDSGSIISGHRRLLEIMMPFSTDRVSDGKPAMPQARICTGSASTEPIVVLGVCGMECHASFSSHSLYSAARYWPVNAPMYPIAPAACSASPTRWSYLTVRLSTDSSQRARSPPRPPMSFCARSILVEVSSTLLARCSFSATVVLYVTSSCARRCSTSASLRRATSSCSIVSLSWICDCASCARLGSTMRLMW